MLGVHDLLEGAAASEVEVGPPAMQGMQKHISKWTFQQIYNA